jgi:hypothetical protein
MKNATLNRLNPHFKSKYADLAGIRDAVTPALSKHGIAVVQGTEMDGERLVVTTRIVHASGQWFESKFPIAIDKPQAMGSSYTYAKRYSLAAICNIAADEDDDANAASASPAAAPTAAKSPPTYDRNPIVKDAFTELQNGIRQCANVGTMDDLKVFWTANAKTIAALPADWKRELEDMKEEAKVTLEQRAA